MIDGTYEESCYFKELVRETLLKFFAWDNDRLSIIIGLKGFLGRKMFTGISRQGDTYKLLRYTVLPTLQKDRRRIEEKKQKKLDFLAKILDEAERHTEAHVVRIIDKPCIEELNIRWKNMSAIERIKVVYK